MPFALPVIYILFLYAVKYIKVLLYKFIKYVYQHHKFVTVNAFYLSLALTLVCEMLLWVSQSMSMIVKLEIPG